MFPVWNKQRPRTTPQKECLRTKQAGKVWNDYLVSKLTSIGFVQSNIDKCVFYRGSIIYILYMENSILAGPNQKEIDDAINDIKKANLDITIEGSLDELLGVKITKQQDGSMVMKQEHLIDTILEDLHMTDTKPSPNPARSDTTLKHHLDSKPFDKSFHYWLVLGKMSYVSTSTRPDISYIVHQCACFCTNPRTEHGSAMRRIARYLAGTKHKGTILKPDHSKGLEVHLDADISGN